ncbi:CoA transferase [Allopusillimonas soli]|uniref:CoA transferase n=1 Tax=Allopusillimonas soli TaxID=659016 RepID=A0A853FCY2_9BURK|nr:CoA transferase [Allopusillimonas soli]TEA75587.1 CoA transferase [Allopusillimonas soli]
MSGQRAALSSRALDGLTVLDVAGPWGGYCGKLFADMGAEVILIEPPAGAATRHDEPYIHGASGRENSLVFQYQNTNKKSVVLDLNSESGQAALRKLSRKAHLLIESEAPGVMAERGLSYEDLQSDAPQLVMVSMTAFGQKGPYAQWQGNDIVAMAMGGMLYLAGYTDTSPMVAFGEQAVGAVNVFGAVAAMAAVFEAEESGRGQHIDVSAQECVVMGMENAVQFYDLEGTVRQRNAGEQRLAGTGVFPCDDGYVYLMAGGVGGNRFWPDTARWLIDEGVPGATSLTDACWLDTKFLSSKEAKDRFAEIFIPFALKHTKAALQSKGRERRIPIAPINDTSELDTAQRQHRRYFVETASSAGVRLRMPGAPYMLSETPWALHHAAPVLGQHTEEVFLAQGFSKEQIHVLLMSKGDIQ